MRKVSLIASELAALALVSATSAFAQNEVTINVDTSGLPVIGANTSIGTVIAFVVGAAVVFGIIAALLFVVIGAFQWITSGGDKAKVESARNHIVAAIVGLLVIVLSIVIVNFALTIILGQSLTNLHFRSLKGGTQ